MSKRLTIPSMLLISLGLNSCTLLDFGKKPEEPLPKHNPDNDPFFMYINDPDLEDASSIAKGYANRGVFEMARDGGRPAGRLRDPLPDGSPAPPFNPEDPQNDFYVHPYGYKLLDRNGDGMASFIETIIYGATTSALIVERGVEKAIRDKLSKAYEAAVRDGPKVEFIMPPSGKPEHSNYASDQPNPSSGPKITPPPRR